MQENETKTSNFLENIMTDAAKQAIGDNAKWRRCSPDHPPCAVCKEPIFGVPLRLFSTGKPVYEMAFHMKCVFQEGTLVGDDDEDPPLAGYGDCFCGICKTRRKCPHLSKVAQHNFAVQFDHGRTY